MTDEPPVSLGAKRALKSHDNRHWTPVECLLDCLNDIRMGTTKCNKLLILRLDTDEGEKFGVGYHAANIKASEILSALEVAKAIILQEMGYLE